MNDDSNTCCERGPSCCRVNRTYSAFADRATLLAYEEAVQHAITLDNAFEVCVASAGGPLHPFASCLCSLQDVN